MHRCKSSQISVAISEVPSTTHTQMMLGVILLIFAVELGDHFNIAASESLQETKTWNSDTNFLNPRNWENKELPCANDRIIFPESSPVITLMPESLTVGELVLPGNGEIIFPSMAALELTGGKREGACTGKDLHFKETVDYWYDPMNWNITSPFVTPRTQNRKNLAVPHAFQIPCPTDFVQFPKETTFRTVVLYPLTKVSSMEINGMHYSQKDFDSFLQTHMGSLLFPGSPRIEITSAVCRNISGCSCGNDGPEVLPTICNQVTPFCPDLDCTDPITPVGSCCPICGAQLLIKPTDNTELTSLVSLYETVISREDLIYVESYSSKTHKGDIQSVFVDSDQNKGVASAAAQIIYDALDAQCLKFGNDPYICAIKGTPGTSIRSATIVKSTEWKRGVPIYGHSTSEGMSSGGVAALVIILLVVLGLGAAFFIYKKRHISGFNFARFDLRGDKIELELGTTPHDELQPVDLPEPPTAPPEGTSKGFDNPVYGTTVEEVSPSYDESPSDTKDYVENPMFTIFEEK